MEHPLNIRQSLRNLKSLEGPFQEIDFTNVPETPQELFMEWLDAAIASGIPEPHAMTLATVDEMGLPDARVLILKNLDSRGWHFASSRSSPKGRQIAVTPQVALTFYWSKLGRQVRIRGTAVPLSQEESTRDYLARSEDARAGVMLEAQSAPLGDIAEIAAAVSVARERVRLEPGLNASNWCVYAVDPMQVEFWQGSTDRLHRRLRFHREEPTEKWQIQLLWP